MSPDKPDNSRERASRFQVGEWTIDPVLDEISRGDETVKLEPRMMRLLCTLAESPGKVVSSRQLLDEVWAGVVVGTASVYQAVSTLRKLLGDNNETPTYIATVARKGYRLVSQVDRSAGSATSIDASALTPGVVHRGSRRLQIWGIAAVVLLAVTSASPSTWSNSQPGSQLGTSTTAAQPGSSPTIPSLVLLPLRPTTAGNPNEIFSETLTDLLSERLATQKTLLLLSMNLAFNLKDTPLDDREVAARSTARYALSGTASRNEETVLADLSLLDIKSGTVVWKQSYARPKKDITALREEIVAQLAVKLGVTVNAVGNSPVNLPAYEIYMRGIAEILKFNQQGLAAARDLFQRDITLYPEFSRGYFGKALALEEIATYPELIGNDGASVIPQMRSALDRAITLDPDFGEALIYRAAYTNDPADAEKMFFRGIELIPGYDIGAFSYARFLLGQGRTGEGLSAIDRGLRLDPLSPLLLKIKASCELLDRGDVAGSEALLRESLSIQPNDMNAEQLLASLLYTRRGKTAESIGIFEKLIARDPTEAFWRYWAAIAYLDVNDPDTAAAVSTDVPYVQFEIAQFRGAPLPWKTLPADDRMKTWLRWSLLTRNPVSDVIRDQAIASGDFATALADSEDFHKWPGMDPPQLFNSDLARAHTLILAGDVERGRALASSVLRTVEVEQIERPAAWFARTRAVAFVILGDDDRALEELAASQKQGDFVRWWYTAELDPLFAHLRGDPRFQRLAAAAKRHRAEQRALVDEMRRTGAIPSRSRAASAGRATQKS